MLTPQQIAQKWRNRAAAAGPAITQAVQQMREADNPMQKAANRADQWAEGCRRAAQNGSFAAGCRSVSMEDWRRAMLQKGVPNYQNGLAAGETKMQRFLDQFIPHVQQGQRALESTPRGTLEQNLQRSAAMIRHLATFRFNRGQGGVFPGPMPLAQ